MGVISSHQIIILILLHFVSCCVSSNDDQSVSRNTGGIEPWRPATSPNPAVTDLHNEYHNIFHYGNRNAASHLWATFLLQRAPQMTFDRLVFFFQGFCSVSGSPVRPSDYTRYRVTLPLVNTLTELTGFMYYCCWPCICDTQDFIRVDTLNVTDRHGITRKHNFAVIGNPCDNPEKLQEPFVQPFSGGRATTLAETAKEVRCGKGGVLEGATVSDNGYIIIGMFFDAVEANEEREDMGIQRIVDDPTPGRISNTSVQGKAVNFHDETEWLGFSSSHCTERARDGYNSGMGEIFRKVCAISPIKPSIAHEQMTLEIRSDGLVQ